MSWRAARRSARKRAVLTAESLGAASAKDPQVRDWTARAQEIADAWLKSNIKSLWLHRDPSPQYESLGKAFAKLAAEAYQAGLTQHDCYCTSAVNDGKTTEMAEAAEWRRALESIAANTCCSHCHEAALVAQDALRAKEKP